MKQIGNYFLTFCTRYKARKGKETDHKKESVLYYRCIITEDGKGYKFIKAHGFQLDYKGYTFYYTFQNYGVYIFEGDSGCLLGDYDEITDVRKVVKKEMKNPDFRNLVKQTIKISGGSPLYKKRMMHGAGKE